MNTHPDDFGNLRQPGALEPRGTAPSWYRPRTAVAARRLPELPLLILILGGVATLAWNGLLVWVLASIFF